MNQSLSTTGSSLLLFSSGGGALLHGEPVQVHLGDSTGQGAARHQVFLRLSGQNGERDEDQRPRCSAHLEDQQVRLGSSKTNLKKKKRRRHFDLHSCVNINEVGGEVRNSGGCISPLFVCLVTADI